MRRVNASVHRWAMFAAAFVTILSLGFGATRSLAQDSWSPGQYMRQSMTTMLAAGAVVQATDDGFGFSDTCYLGAYLRVGCNSFLTTQLVEGKSYAFIAAGSCDGCDVDLILEDQNGREIVKDDKDDSAAMVIFTPRSTQRYTIRLRLYSASAPSFCGMLLMHKGGWNVPIKNLDSAINNILGNCNNIAKQLPVKFLDTPGEWGMMGQIIGANQAGGFNDIRMGTGHRVITCAGDATTDDIDLAIFEDGQKPTLVGSDTDPDARPLVNCRTSDYRRYTVGIKNAKARGASLIMTAQLAAD